MYKKVDRCPSTILILGELSSRQCSLPPDHKGAHIAAPDSSLIGMSKIAAWGTEIRPDGAVHVLDVRHFLNKNEMYNDTKWFMKFKGLNMP